MGGVWEALYRAVAAGVGCQCFAEHCWLPNLVPHLAGQGVRHRLTWQHRHRLLLIPSSAPPPPAATPCPQPLAGLAAPTPTQIDCPWIAGGSNISMLEPAVGGWKHTILRSTKACHHMGSAHRGRRRKAVVVCRSPCASRDPAASPQTQPVPPPQTQPLAGTASTQTQPVPPPQTQPWAGTAFPQTQPPQTPRGDARGDDDDDENDYEGLDSRAAIGEQSFEEETAQAERQHPRHPLAVNLHVQLSCRATPTNGWVEPVM